MSIALQVGQRVKLEWYDGHKRDDATVSAILPHDAVEITFDDEPEDPYMYELGDGCTTLYFEVNNSTIPVLIEPIV